MSEPPALFGNHGDARGKIEHKGGEIRAQCTTSDNLARRRGNLRAEDSLQRVAQTVVARNIDGRDQRLSRVDLPTSRSFRRVGRLRGERLNGCEAVTRLFAACLRLFTRDHAQTRVAVYGFSRRGKSRGKSAPG